MIDTSLDSFNFYFFIAVIQGFILAGIILFKKPRWKPNIYLSLLIFFFSMTLLHLILESSISGFNSRFPIPMDFGFAFGPLAYLHVITLKNPRNKTTTKTYLHFLPSLLLDVGLFLLVFISIRSNEDWAYANITMIQTFALGMIALNLIHLTSYTYLIYAESKSIQTPSKEFQSLRKWFQTISRTWVLMIGFLAFAIPVALINIEILDDNSHLLYRPLGIIVAICIYGLGYLYLTKYLSTVNKFIGKASNIRFTESQLEQRKKELISIIETDKLYKDQKLSLSKLAEHCSWPINDMSIIINEALSTNFNDLINGFRVTAFKELASQPEVKNYSILGIAQEVGFGSKASFYRAFKKEMGITPSQYLNK